MNWQQLFFRFLGGFLVGYSLCWLIISKWCERSGVRKPFKKDYLAPPEDWVSQKEDSSNG